MGKCCDICGDVGFVDALITCSRCKSSQEHLYCMSTFPEACPENWYCDDCKNFNPPSERSDQMIPLTAQQQMNHSYEGLGGGDVSPTSEMQIADPISVPLTIIPMDDDGLYAPAVDASWRGSFNVLLSDTLEWKINGSIKAYPTFGGHKTIYELATLMPEVLNFELVQLGSVWMSLFEKRSPNIRDINLYFFPSNLERCNSYISLLEVMEEHDFLLKYYSGGLELLIFTSKILPADRQRWKRSYFLWGLFHYQHKGNGSGNGVAGTEIDTTGGINVGRSDAAAPMIPSLLPPLGIEGETCNEVPLGLERNVGRRSDTAPKIPVLLPIPDLNKEPDEIPPNVEAIYRPMYVPK